MIRCIYVSRMRCLVLATFILVIAASTGVAQPIGEVESIGFNNVYRPGCWTPMVVRIKPNGALSGTYQLQIKQRDLDNDVAVFTRNITLTGSEGGGRDQRFWMYFIPQPVGRGLPSARDGASLKDVQELIEVYLCNESGKQITQLPITAVPDSVDPPSTDGRRGVRLVIAVNDGGSRVAWAEYSDGLTDRNALLGVLEDVVFISLRTRDLPENVLAYDAVDAILWLDADPAALKADGGAREQAIDTYIRAGGHLVISQPANWQPTLAFGPLLPVELKGVTDRPDPEPLRTLAKAPVQGRRERPLGAGWNAIKGPFRVAIATPKQNALVDEWMTLTDVPGRHPFIARQVVGCGAVTWVAQDLGDPALTSLAKTGWLNVWDHVFGWQNDPVAGRSILQEDKDRYPAAAAVDLGKTLTVFEDKTKVGLFITLAVVFFILYWLLAGPGLYLFLASRNRAQYSWFAYAGAAVVATLLTVLIVKLVLRGPPRLDHLTVVRGSNDASGVVRSRFGVYIPRDGDQKLEVAQPAEAGGVSAISALPLHPAHLLDEIDSAGKLSYTVPVRDAVSADRASMTVPYRSTLKQFESRWTGKVDGRIQGIVQVSPDIPGNLDGRLTNGTGRDLFDVYIAYKIPTGGRWQNWMLYLPSWKDGITIDLQRERTGDRGEANGRPAARIVGIDGAIPGGTINLIGEIGRDWRDFWVPDLRAGTQMGDALWDDKFGRPRRAMPMLTMFDAIQPAYADATRGRIEFQRKGARHMSLSPALAAGALVVVAEAIDAPQPIGIEVEGDIVPGNGRIVYQFVLPTIRKAEEAPVPSPGTPGEG